MIKAVAVFIIFLHSSQTSHLLCPFIAVPVAASGLRQAISLISGWASACRMLPPCWQLAWEGFCAADLGKELEKTEERNVSLPPLPVCESEPLGFGLCSCTKGPFSLLVPRLSFLTVPTVLASRYHSRDKLGWLNVLCCSKGLLQLTYNTLTL